MLPFLEAQLRPNESFLLFGLDEQNSSVTYTLRVEVPDDVVEVPIDIKPQSCPNPINVKSHGVLPVAIVGGIDVTTIDPASIRLAGVAPLRSAIEDVTTPFDVPLSEPPDALDCTDLGPDGTDDLTLKFKTQQIVDALGEVADGDVRVLTLTGTLIDGTLIQGEDVVIIRKKGK